MESKHEDRNDLEDSPVNSGKNLLGKIKVSRRNFGRLTLGGLVSAIADQLVLDGLGGRYVELLLTNPTFRKKLIESITSGEYKEDIRDVIESNFGKIQKAINLGNKLEDIKDPFLGNCFDKVEFYKINGRLPEYREQIMFVAELGKSLPVSSEVVEIEGKLYGSFTKTVQKIPYPVITLPGPPVTPGTLPTNITESYYKLNKDKPLQKFNGEGFVGDGGIYINGKGGLLVVTYDEMQEIIQNPGDTLALEGYGFTYNSSTSQEEFLAQIDTSEILSQKLLSNLVAYNSFLVTFYTQNNEFRTCVFSSYTGFDSESGQIRGAFGQDTLWTIRDMLQMIDNYKGLHPEFVESTMLVPDAGSRDNLMSSYGLPIEELKQLQEKHGIRLFSPGGINGTDYITEDLAKKIGSNAYRTFGDHFFQLPKPKRVMIVATASNNF